MLKPAALLWIVVGIWTNVAAGDLTVRSDAKRTVYFKAYMSKDQYLLKGATLKFDNVVANIGKGYNRHSGVFTAPVSGIYLLSATIGTQESGTFDVYLKNEDDIPAYISIQSGHETGPLTTIAYVKKGNHVFVMRGVGPGKTFRGWRLTQFSAILLRAD